MPATTETADAIAREIARCEQLLLRYDAVASVAAAIRQRIEWAEQVTRDNDQVQMTRALDNLRAYR